MDRSMKPLDVVFGGAYAQQRQRVLRNTYALLALSMVPTVLGAWLGVAFNFSLFSGSPLIGFMLFMGISFAIPIDEAIRVSDQLRTSGRVQRGRLGVQIDQVSKDVAESLGLSKAQGALVRAVEPGSPADKAGLEAGDIILRFDGKPIEKSIDLPRLVGNTKPGSRVTIQVWRRGSSRDMTLTVGEFEPEKPTKKAAATPDRPATAVAKALGLTIPQSILVRATKVIE
mgnify:CR=1 FL=1